MKVKIIVCPNCGANWDGGDIYEALRQHSLYKNKTDDEVKVIAGQYGWSEENKTRFSKIIGVENPRIYDGVSWWRCPECNTEWDRNDPAIYTTHPQPPKN